MSRGSPPGSEGPAPRRLKTAAAAVAAWLLLPMIHEAELSASARGLASALQQAQGWRGNAEISVSPIQLCLRRDGTVSTDAECRDGVFATGLLVGRCGRWDVAAARDAGVLRTVVFSPDGRVDAGETVLTYTDAGPSEFGGAAAVLSETPDSLAYYYDVPTDDTRNNVAYVQVVVGGTKYYYVRDDNPANTDWTYIYDVLADGGPTPACRCYFGRQPAECGPGHVAVRLGPLAFRSWEPFGQVPKGGPAALVAVDRFFCQGSPCGDFYARWRAAVRRPGGLFPQGGPYAVGRACYLITPRLTDNALYVYAAYGESGSVWRAHAQHAGRWVIFGREVDVYVVEARAG